MTNQTKENKTEKQHSCAFQIIYGKLLCTIERSQNKAYFRHDESNKVKHSLLYFPLFHFSYCLIDVKVTICSFRLTHDFANTSNSNSEKKNYASLKLKLVAKIFAHNIRKTVQPLCMNQVNLKTKHSGTTIS